MGSPLIEEVLEKKIMDLISERLQGTTITIAGFWQSVSTGEVKKYNPPLLTVSLSPIFNETPGVPRYKTSVSIALTIPRSVDTRTELMLETCRNLLPFINSFAGICNKTIKSKISNEPDYTVVGIFDESSDSSFHRESDNWVVIRDFTVSLVTH